MFICFLIFVLVLVLVLVDDELLSCSAVSAHIFSVSIQFVLEHTDNCENCCFNDQQFVPLVQYMLAEQILSNIITPYATL